MWWKTTSRSQRSLCHHHRWSHTHHVIDHVLITQLELIRLSPRCHRWRNLLWQWCYTSQATRHFSYCLYHSMPGPQMAATFAVPTRPFLTMLLIYNSDNGFIRTSCSSITRFFITCSWILMTYSRIEEANWWYLQAPIRLVRWLQYRRHLHTQCRRFRVNPLAVLYSITVPLVLGLHLHARKSGAIISVPFVWKRDQRTWQRVSICCETIFLRAFLQKVSRSIL